MKSKKTYLKIPSPTKSHGTNYAYSVKISNFKITIVSLIIMWMWTITLLFKKYKTLLFPNGVSLTCIISFPKLQRKFRILSWQSSQGLMLAESLSYLIKERQAPIFYKIIRKRKSLFSNHMISSLSHHQIHAAT